VKENNCKREKKKYYKAHESDYMRVKTKVSILSGVVALFFLSLLVSIILGGFNIGIFTDVDSETFTRIAIGGFLGFAGIVIFFKEFRIPKEKHVKSGKVGDVKLRTLGPARVMIFDLEDSAVAFGAPTPLFSPPDLSGEKIEVYGDKIRSDNLPDFIFWGTDKYLKSVAQEIFFATRIKNLSTSEEYEAPLFMPAFQIVLWVLITIAPFIFLPASVLLGLREMIHVGVQWILIPVFGIIGLILAIILPNWIIEKREQQRK
jgi:hypothetical protein